MRPAEFRFQNKRLSIWLRGLDYWRGDTNDPAFVAFTHMPTNPIPPLLEIIRSPRTPSQEVIHKFNRKQSFLRIDEGKSWRRSSAASWALYAMGTNARPAFHALTNLLFETNALFSSTIPLAAMGSDGIGVLIVALTNQDWRIRDSAAVGLGW